MFLAALVWLSGAAWAIDTPAGCGPAETKNVAKSGYPYTDIQSAVNALTVNMSTEACVVIMDAETYSEQVNVQNFINNGYRLRIMADPAFVSSAPVVAPPAFSTAAFQILNDSVTVQGISVISTNTISYGVYVSSTNAVINSVVVTDTLNFVSDSGLYIGANSYVTGSYFKMQGAHGITLGSNNTVELSTFTNAVFGKYSLNLSGGGSSNSFSQIYLSNPSGNAAYLLGANSNTFTQSRVNSGLNSSGSFYIQNSASNQITQSFITNQPGYALQFDNTANNNTVSLSTITTAMSGGSNGAAVMIGAMSGGGPYANTVTQCYITNTAGPAVSFQVNAHDNNISWSTMTSFGSTYPALYLEKVSTETIANSYIAGASAVNINRSTGTVISSSIMVATNTTGNAVSFTGLGLNLSISSCVITGGAQGAGIAVGDWGAGLISLASNTVTGGQYGLSISTLSANAVFSVSSITFQNLTYGATAINFLGGQFVSTVTAAVFSSTNMAVDVNGSLLTSGSRITMRDASGAFAGASYENDPSGYVDWDDVAPPTVRILVPANNSYVGNLAAITGTAGDNAAVSLVKMTLNRLSDNWYWNGASWDAAQTWLSVTGTTAWSYATPVWVDGSTYTAVAKAMDTLNNWSTEYATTTFTYDSLAPVSTITYPAHAAVLEIDLPVISGSASDFAGTLSSVRVSYACASGVCVGKYWDITTHAWDSVTEIFYDATILSDSKWEATGASTPTWITDGNGIQYNIFAKAMDLTGNETAKPGAPAADTSYIQVMLKTPYKTKAGTASSWQWKIPQTGDYVPSGSADSWQWLIWTPASGRKVPRGDASGWTWGNE